MLKEGDSIRVSFLPDGTDKEIILGEYTDNYSLNDYGILYIHANLEIDEPTMQKIRLYKKPEYDIKLQGIFGYYYDIVKVHGISKLWEKTDSGYYRFLARGYCSHKLKKICVIKRFADVNLILHEVGHEIGFKHTDKDGVIMNPHIHKRGSKGRKEILDKYYQKYGYDTWSKLAEIIDKVGY